MDLKKMGLEELSYEEATHIDGGNAIDGLIAIFTEFPLLAGAFESAIGDYIDAVKAAFEL